ncbi:MAG: AtpZ/AtpI family protein, partial [Chloroflexota bacterium]
ALRFIGIGWYVALCIVLGAVLGRWLDQKLQTTPWLAIAGIIVGSFFAFFGLYQMVQPWMDQKGKKK